MDTDKHRWITVARIHLIILCFEDKTNVNLYCAVLSVFICVHLWLRIPFSLPSKVPVYQIMGQGAPLAPAAPVTDEIAQVGRHLRQLTG